ncbi:MAG TPA: hypothetical protein VGW75_12885 [Solirubrobacteraceae bacterium]|jgi:hypothetical protein|nr:hypothetical protein [Solirubrobacteraceae bacterium]
MTTLRRVTLLALAALLALPGAALAQDRHSANMSLVKNLRFDVREDLGQSIPYGTDVEFAKIKHKRYAFAGSEINGLQIVDITTPTKARIVKVYDCAVSQGDPQVFRRGDRTLVAYANDYESTTDTAASRCYQDLKAAGFAAIDAQGRSKLGTVIIDVTNPIKPRAVSFVAIPTGSHNTTVHPSGRFLYNSNSDLIGLGGLAAIEVFDISNLAAPRMVKELALTPLPGLGTESHDITFNKRGTRAYSAALSHGVIIDTTNPADPKVVSEFDDESINVWHQSDPVTIGGRDFLIVEDEVAGAAAPGVCPTGGVHVFDISDETLPVKVGYWNISDPAVRNPDDTCTAHVFDIHEDEQIMTIAYYMGGVRVVDLSGLAAAPIGVGQGEMTLVGGAMRQIGHYVVPDANAWSAKTPFIEPDGDFYLYADDINRGLDVYRFEAERRTSRDAGTFTSAAKAGESVTTGAVLDAVSSATAQQQEQRSSTQQTQLLCLLKAARQR